MKIKVSTNLRILALKCHLLWSIKLWEWSHRLGLEPGLNSIAHNSAGMAEAADFFLRTPTLTASNFAALWPKDPKFWASKHFSHFLNETKVQEASNILKVGFVLSKWPHFNSIYLVRVPFPTGIAVHVI